MKTIALILAFFSFSLVLYPCEHGVYVSAEGVNSITKNDKIHKCEDEYCSPNCSKTAVTKLSQIDFTKIKLPLITDLIQNQIDNGVIFFQDLKSTAPNENEISSFGMVEDVFYLDFPLSKVFEHYVVVNPSEAWMGGKMVSFGLGLDKNSGEIFYPGEDFPGAKQGQVMYINMSFLGLKKIAIAQEIILIDTANSTIVFSYIDGGMTKGKQVMEFSSAGENKTKIVHTSYYKGVSAFRDKYLYAYFHTKVVRKFHQNLLESLGENENSQINNLSYTSKRGKL